MDRSCLRAQRTARAAVDDGQDLGHDRCGDLLRAIGPAAERLARAEGLEAHALSVAARLGRSN